MSSRDAFQPQPLCGSVAWNGIFPEQVFKISLSEILLLRGLHVVEDEVLFLVSKSSDGSEAQSRKAFLLCECLCAEMVHLFSKNSTQPLCLLCFYFWFEQKAAISKGSVRSESVERSKEEGEVAGKNMVRGRENNAREEIFRINGHLQSGRLC